MNIREICAICCLTFAFMLVAHATSVKSVKSDVFITTTENTNFHKNIRAFLFVFFCVICCFKIILSLSSLLPLYPSSAHPVLR